MKKDISQISKLLPKGSVNKISLITNIPQSTVSKTLRGKKLRGYEKVEEQAYIILKEVKEELNVIFK
ncbi:hypothetical protein [Bacteroides sp. 14(A)]|uniref:hypothetical protein n=1 Tax=Bacteroides sp. 14(A) TaxID=1163670 RepID=UPI0004786270|nr:hypothetical protein [Bacteroides sp. 14(A)]